MKPKSPVQKNNLVVFPCEYTYVYPNRYTWYICIVMMIYTSLQEYLYPLIQRKSITQTSLVYMQAHAQLLKSIWVLDCAILNAGKYKAEAWNLHLHVAPSISIHPLFLPTR